MRTGWAPMTSAATSVARLVYGARVSLQAGLIAVAVAVVIGVPIGVVAGYVGGWSDNLLIRAVDTLLAFPAIILAIGITAALGRGLVNSMIAVGVVFSPGIARITRTQVQLTKDRLYVDAAVGFGSSTWRTMRRHVVPNMIGPVIVQATFLFGLALLAEASLSFLGLGVQAPTSSWGSMLRRSSQFLAQSPNAIYVPGLAIALTVLSVNVLGDSLRDAVDPAAQQPSAPATCGYHGRPDAYPAHRRHRLIRDVRVLKLAGSVAGAYPHDCSHRRAPRSCWWSRPKEPRTGGTPPIRRRRRRPG